MLQNWVHVLFIASFTAPCYLKTLVAWNEVFKFSIKALLFMMFLKEISDYSSFPVALDQTWIDVDTTSFKGYFSHQGGDSPRAAFWKIITNCSTLRNQAPKEVLILNFPSAEASLFIYMDCCFPFQWGYCMYCMGLHKQIKHYGIQYSQIVGNIGMWLKPIPPT